MGNFLIIKKIEGAIEIPSDFIMKNSIVDFVFGKRISLKDIESFSDRAIYALKMMQLTKSMIKLLNDLKANLKPI